MQAMNVDALKKKLSERPLVDAFISKRLIKSLQKEIGD
jgi:hypothetical protein